MKIAFTVVAIVFALIIWKIHHDDEKAVEQIVATVQPAEDRFNEYMEKIKLQRDANAVKEINEKMPLGEAGSAVRTFFRHWKDGRYNEMRDMLSAPPYDPDSFAIQLRRAPFNWRHLEIVNEKPDGDGWKVAFRLEITSPESALAAVAIDEDASYRDLKGAYAAYTIQPLILGIEKFTRFDFEWSVVKTDGKLWIGTFPDKKEKGIDLIGYITNDSLATMRLIGMFQGPGAGQNIQEQVRTVMALWLTFADPELNLDEKRSAQVIKDAMALIVKGKDNLKLINDGVVAIRLQGRTPTIPQ